VTVHTLQAPAPNLPLKAGMQLRLVAVDPTTGANVTGVTISEWAIYGDDESEGLAEDVVPLYSLELDEGTV
jgi:hypothetical protein